MVPAGLGTGRIHRCAVCVIVDLAMPSLAGSPEHRGIRNCGDPIKFSETDGSGLARSLGEALRSIILLPNSVCSIPSELRPFCLYPNLY